jgi:hypothetical protein
MNLRPILTSIVLAACLTGCATFSDVELHQMRQRGVAPTVVGKMVEGHALTPADVIELAHRGVPDEFIIRQIDDAGVDYILSRSDFKKLQAAQVSRPVMDALIAASEDFAGRNNPSRARVYAGYPYDDYYGPYPYPYYYPYPYGVSVEVGGGRDWGHHHHWR